MASLVNVTEAGIINGKTSNSFVGTELSARDRKENPSSSGWAAREISSYKVGKRSDVSAKRLIKMLRTMK